MNAPRRTLGEPAGGLLLACLVFIAAFCIVGCASFPRFERAPAGRQLSLPLRDLDGESVLLTGSKCKVTLVLVWATWCDACKSALIYADELHRTAQGAVEVAAISVDADPGYLAGYLAGAPMGPTYLWDPEGEVSARRLAIERVPTILIVDVDGRIRRVFSGWDRGSERAISRAVATFWPQDYCLDAPGGTH